jgi:hypothetical protein
MAILGFIRCLPSKSFDEAEQVGALDTAILNECGLSGVGHVETPISDPIPRNL